MSFWELIVIVLVGLVVVKPERLPEITDRLGRLMAQIKAFSQQIFDQYEQ